MIHINPARLNQVDLNAAAAALRRGALVLLPTETVYGIAADPKQPDAMSKLYAVKGRDAGKPIAYFIHQRTQITELGAQLSDPAEKLAARFWPGPLTLVLPAHERFLGFRMPDDPTALELTRQYGPLAVTSANRSGSPEALTAQEAFDIFGAQIEVYLDAGPSRGTIPSSVVQVFPDQSIRILRAGAIAPETITEVLAG